MLSALPAIRDLALTTNGLLAAEHAVALRAAGLNRLNVSLDTLDEASFRQITRREGLDRVIAGIDAAIARGFPKIRINAIAIRGITEARRSRDSSSSPRIEASSLRFIEFMPLDADGTGPSTMC